MGLGGIANGGWGKEPSFRRENSGGGLFLKTHYVHVVPLGGVWHPSANRPGFRGNRAVNRLSRTKRQVQNKSVQYKKPKTKAVRGYTDSAVNRDKNQCDGSIRLREVCKNITEKFLYHIRLFFFIIRVGIFGRVLGCVQGLPCVVGVA